MKVGHTHCDIDATFANLSKDVYGKHSRGDSVKDLFSLSGFKKLCGEVYGPRLQTFEDIRRVYNFDDFVKDYRPKNADKKIKKHFRLELQVKRAGRVFVRSKQAIGARTPWNESVQIYPSLLDLQPHRPHSPTTRPALADNHEWEDFEDKIVPTLRK